MDDPICQRFAANVRRIRRAKDISQDALADLAGVHRTYVSDVERGARNPDLARNPSIAIVAKIARALGVNPGELLDE